MWPLKTGRGVYFRELCLGAGNRHVNRSQTKLWRSVVGVAGPAHAGSAISCRGVRKGCTGEVVPKLSRERWASVYVLGRWERTLSGGNDVCKGPCLGREQIV